MEVAIPKSLEALVRRKVQERHYSTEEEVVADALRLMQVRDEVVAVTGIQMATSGRHCIFFEADEARILIVRVLHDKMDYRRHLGTADLPEDEGLSPSGGLPQAVHRTQPAAELVPTR